eukprot:365471-Chlamydomonas_euryale.AAC.8
MTGLIVTGLIVTGLIVTGPRPLNEPYDHDRAPQPRSTCLSQLDECGVVRLDVAGGAEALDGPVILFQIHQAPARHVRVCDRRAFSFMHQVPGVNLLGFHILFGASVLLLRLSICHATRGNIEAADAIVFHTMAGSGLALLLTCRLARASGQMQRTGQGTEKEQDTEQDTGRRVGAGHRAPGRSKIRGAGVGAGYGARGRRRRGTHMPLLCIISQSGAPILAASSYASIAARCLPKRYSDRATCTCLGTHPQHVPWVPDAFNSRTSSTRSFQSSGGEWQQSCKQACWVAMRVAFRRTLNGARRVPPHAQVLSGRAARGSSACADLLQVGHVVWVDGCRLLEQLQRLLDEPCQHSARQHHAHALRPTPR